LNDRGHDVSEKSGVRKPLGRFELPRGPVHKTSASPVLASAATRRQFWKTRRAPATSASGRAPRMMAPISHGCGGPRGSHLSTMKRRGIMNVPEQEAGANRSRPRCETARWSAPLCRSRLGRFPSSRIGDVAKGESGGGGGAPGHSSNVLQFHTKQVKEFDVVYRYPTNAVWQSVERLLWLLGDDIGPVELAGCHASHLPPEGLYCANMGCFMDVESEPELAQWNTVDLA